MVCTAFSCFRKIEEKKGRWDEVPPHTKGQTFSCILDSKYEEDLPRSVSVSIYPNLWLHTGSMDVAMMCGKSSDVRYTRDSMLSLCEEHPYQLDAPSYILGQNAKQKKI